MSRLVGKKYPGVYSRGSGYAGKVQFRGRSHWTRVCATQREASELRSTLRKDLERRLRPAPGQLPRTLAPFREHWLAALRKELGIHLFNDLQLPAEAVAQQLGHTDGGALVMKLYGHPDEGLQRRRIRDAFATRGSQNVAARSLNRRTTSHD